jgi:hypothetical protein
MVTEDLLITRNKFLVIIIIIIIFSYKFCERNFSEMHDSISVKFSGMIDIDLKFTQFFSILNTLILTSDIDVLTIFRGWLVRECSQKLSKLWTWNFQRL